MADAPKILNNIYQPGLSEAEIGLVKWALSYAHEQLLDAQADGEGSITIGDRIDELEALNYKLDFLDADDYGEPDGTGGLNGDEAYSD